LPGRDLTLTGLEHVAEDHLIDHARVQPGALDGTGNGGATQVNGVEWLETTPVASDRGSGDAGDD
jgi:hypothetical protein